MAETHILGLTSPFNRWGPGSICNILVLLHSVVKAVAGVHFLFLFAMVEMDFSSKPALMCKCKLQIDPNAQKLHHHHCLTIKQSHHHDYHCQVHQKNALWQPNRFFGQGDGMDWNKRILWCMHTVTILNPAAGLIFSANNGQVGKVGPKYIQMRTRLASFSTLTYSGWMR